MTPRPSDLWPAPNGQLAPARQVATCTSRPTTSLTALRPDERLVLRRRCRPACQSCPPGNVLEGGPQSTKGATPRALYVSPVSALADRRLRGAPGLGGRRLSSSCSRRFLLLVDVALGTSAHRRRRPETFPSPASRSGERRAGARLVDVLLRRSAEVPKICSAGVRCHPTQAEYLPRYGTSSVLMSPSTSPSPYGWAETRPVDPSALGCEQITQYVRQRPARRQRRSPGEALSRARRVPSARTHMCAQLDTKSRHQALGGSGSSRIGSPLPSFDHGAHKNENLG